MDNRTTRRRGLIAGVVGVLLVIAAFTVPFPGDWRVLVWNANTACLVVGAILIIQAFGAFTRTRNAEANRERQ